MLCYGRGSQPEDLLQSLQEPDCALRLQHCLVQLETNYGQCLFNKAMQELTIDLSVQKSAQNNEPQKLHGDTVSLIATRRLITTWCRNNSQKSFWLFLFFSPHNEWEHAFIIQLKVSSLLLDITGQRMSLIHTFSAVHVIHSPALSLTASFQ